MAGAVLPMSDFEILPHEAAGIEKAAQWHDRMTAAWKERFNDADRAGETDHLAAMKMGFHGTAAHALRRLLREARSSNPPNLGGGGGSGLYTPNTSK